MRVLFLAHAYPRFVGDPVGSFIANLAVALRDEGIEVAVSAPSAPDLPLHDTLDGIRVERFRYAPRDMETLAYTGTMGAQVKESVRGKLAMGSYLMAALRAAHGLARREKIALVHAHGGSRRASSRRSSAVRAASPFSSRRMAPTCGSRDPFPAARASSRTSHPAHRAMTTVSSWLAREAQQLRPGFDERVMPMPVLGALFHPGDAREEDRMLFVGKLSEQKGLARLLSAMTMMRTRPKLTVVGAGALDDAALREKATTLGLDERIEWLPLLSQADLAVQYRRAAVHVIPGARRRAGSHRGGVAALRDARRRIRLRRAPRHRARR